MGVPNRPLPFFIDETPTSPQTSRSEPFTVRTGGLKARSDDHSPLTVDVAPSILGEHCRQPLREVSRILKGLLKNISPLGIDVALLASLAHKGQPIHERTGRLKTLPSKERGNAASNVAPPAVARAARRGQPFREGPGLQIDRVSQPGPPAVDIPPSPLAGRPGYPLGKGHHVLKGIGDHKFSRKREEAPEPPPAHRRQPLAIIEDGFIGWFDDPIPRWSNKPPQTAERNPRKPPRKHLAPQGRLITRLDRQLSGKIHKTQLALYEHSRPILNEGPCAVIVRIPYPSP